MTNELYNLCCSNKKCERNENINLMIIIEQTCFSKTNTAGHVNSFSGGK